MRNANENAINERIFGMQFPWGMMDKFPKYVNIKWIEELMNDILMGLESCLWSEMNSQTNIWFVIVIRIMIKTKTFYR